MTKPTLAVLAIAAAALLGAACNDEEPKRPPVAADGPASPGMGGVSGGGGTPLDAGTDADAGDANATCTDLDATGGADILQNGVNDDPLAGSGGIIEDGTYDLTGAQRYVGAANLPGPTGSSYRGVIRIAGTGTTFERVIILSTSSAASTETRSSGTLTTDGSNATISLACPSPSTEQVTYSVANASLTMTNLVTKESFTFTRRQ